MTRSDKEEEDSGEMKEVSAFEWYHLLCSANAKAYSEEQSNGITQKNCRQRCRYPICHRGSKIFPQVLWASDVRDKISGTDGEERCKADKAAMLHLPWNVSPWFK